MNEIIETIAINEVKLIANQNGHTITNEQAKQVLDKFAETIAKEVVEGKQPNTTIPRGLVNPNVQTAGFKMQKLIEQAEASKAKVAEHNYKRAVWESLEIAIQHAKVADDPFEFLVNQIQAMQNTEFKATGINNVTELLAEIQRLENMRIKSAGTMISLINQNAELISAIKNLKDVKGRFHTQLAMNRLFALIETPDNPF